MLLLLKKSLTNVYILVDSLIFRSMKILMCTIKYLKLKKVICPNPMNGTRYGAARFVSLQQSTQLLKNSKTRQNLSIHLKSYLREKYTYNMETTWIILFLIVFPSPSSNGYYIIDV